MSTREALADLVRAEICASGQTQTAIAASAGITLKHLNRFLRGHDGMALDLVEKVLTACGRRLVLATQPLPDDAGTETARPA
jgi:DNA-binding phage protein